MNFENPEIRNRGTGRSPTHRPPNLGNLFLGILYRDPSRGASIYNLSPRRIGPILSPTLGKSAWL